MQPLSSSLASGRRRLSPLPKLFRRRDRRGPRQQYNQCMDQMRSSHLPDLVELAIDYVSNLFELSPFDELHNGLAIGQLNCWSIFRNLLALSLPDSRTFFKLSSIDELLNHLPALEHLYVPNMISAYSRQAVEEQIRVALLVSQAAHRFIQGVQVADMQVTVLDDIQAASYQGLGQLGAWVIDILGEQQWLQVVNNSGICSNTWRILGFVSSVVAMVTYSQSLSFKRIFGEWTSLKMYIYCALSFIVCGMTLMPKICRAVNRLLVKPDVVFLAMMVSTLYSYFYDKYMSGKPDIMSLISSGAFSLMSLSVSRQSGMGFEVGFTGFFAALFMLQLMKINVTLTSVTVLVAFIFTRLRQ